MLEIIKNASTTSVSAICAFSTNQFLTGHEDGSIRCWVVNNGQISFQLQLTTKHDAKVVKIIISTPQMLTSRPGKFLSVSDDCRLCVWDALEMKSIRHFKLDNCYFGLEDMVVLEGDLVAIARMHSPAWGSFDVWNFSTGRLLHERNSETHRPHGISVACAKGFLAFHGHCEYKLNIWRVTKNECVEKSTCEDDRIYSMTVTPNGDIITAGHHISLFSINDLGKVKRFREIRNNNVIDTIILLLGYNVLIVDRRRDAGTLWVRNALDESVREHIGDNVIGDTVVDQGTSYDHVHLPESEIAISLFTDEFVVHRIQPSILRTPKQIAKIQKFARIICQSCRTRTGHFWRLTFEILVKIVRIAAVGNRSDAHAHKTVEKVMMDTWTRQEFDQI